VPDGPTGVRAFAKRANAAHHFTSKYLADKDPG